jgi:alpha-tubulin suppressor-like RCC1 family protein
MFASRFRLARLHRRWVGSAVALSTAFSVLSCGSDGLGTVTTQTVGAIAIKGAISPMERGTRLKLTAEVTDPHGRPLDVPVVWSSSNTRVASFDPQGNLTANDSGGTAISASSLGVVSPTFQINVSWDGAATIASAGWTQPNAATPGAVVYDSVHFLVMNIHNQPVGNARVAFTVTGGAGTASPAVGVTSANGLVATQWTLGSKAGLNSVSATVVDSAGQQVPWVQPFVGVKLTVTSYAAMSAVAGDQQTAQILSDLPVAPSVKLVDSLGKPRAGVPITFTATSGGRVAVPTVSTGADGVASPGTWTLGDVPGPQNLVARVESGTFKLQATGTGTPIYYDPVKIALGGFATCGLDSGGATSCMGQEPQRGGGDTVSKSVPTPTGTSVSLQTLAGSLTHFCGVATDTSIYCWGINALVDTTGHSAVLATVPTRLPSGFSWAQASPGASHTCALTIDQDAYCWGANAFGQLGTRGDTAEVFVPTIVYGGFKFATISSGANHACALTPSHDALCWGSNQVGQLGDGTLTNRVAPTLVGGGISFQAIGGGDPWTCGLSTAGKAYCWGAVQNVGTVVTPHAYDGAPVFVSLAVGGFHACALTGSGDAYCWGDNEFGQLGDSTTVNRTNPTPVAGGMKFKTISAGAAHTCGITTQGGLACWGTNVFGEIGDKTTVVRTIPRFIVLGVAP